MSSDDSLHIRVKYFNAQVRELTFKIKKSTELKKVFEVVAARQYKDIELSSIKFLFNDKLISETDTCQSLKLKEDDEIDCCTHSEFLLIKILEELSMTNELSFSDLLEKIKDIPRYAIHDLSFVHLAVISMTKNTSLEDFPDEVSRRSGLFCNGTTQSYLLHLACYNEHCPTSIINLLVEQYPDALRYWETKDDYRQSNGLPLHYYLSREKNIDIDAVKMLAGAYPQAIVTHDDDEMQSTPLDIVISNSNIKNKCDIITCLLDAKPSSISYVDRWGRTKLAKTCIMFNGVDSLFEVVQLLYNEYPEALMISDDYGRLPIHHLCDNIDLDDSTSLDILHLLNKDDAAALLMISDDYGLFPIHYAVINKSANFCKELLAMSPETVRSETFRGNLPIHTACHSGRVDTVQYLLEVYPESAHIANFYGYLPIHGVILNGSEMVDRHTAALELLLEYDPGVASKVETEMLRLPLHLACHTGNLHTIQLLFDTYPEAIWARDRNGNTPLDLLWKSDSIGNIPLIKFLEGQLKYVSKHESQGNDSNLPLYRALYDNATLGVIKLLLDGSSDTLQLANSQGLLPIHIACEFSSVKVVNYLLDKQIAVLSARNSDQKLPIHLLCESGGEDESVSYVETIYRMLLANPEL